MMKKFSSAFIVFVLFGLLGIIFSSCGPCPDVFPLKFKVGFFLKDRNENPYFLLANSNYWYPRSYDVFSDMKCWTDVVTYELGVTEVISWKTQKFSGKCKEDKYYDIYIPVPILYNDYFYLLGPDNTASGPFYLRNVTGESSGTPWYDVGWKIWDSGDAIVPGVLVKNIPFFFNIRNGEFVADTKKLLFRGADGRGEYSLSCDSLPSSEGYFVFDRVKEKWFFISKDASKYEFWSLTFTESTSSDFQCHTDKLDYLPVTGAENFSHAFIANNYFAGEVTTTLQDVWVKIFDLTGDKEGHYIHFTLSETSDIKKEGWCSYLSELIPLKTGLLFIFSVGEFCEGNSDVRGMGIGYYFARYDDLAQLTEAEIPRPSYLLFVNREMGGGIVVSGDTVFATGVQNENLFQESIFQGSYENPPSWAAYILSGRFNPDTGKFGFIQLKKFSLLR